MLIVIVGKLIDICLPSPIKMLFDPVYHAKRKLVLQQIIEALKWPSKVDPQKLRTQRNKQRKHDGRQTAFVCLISVASHGILLGYTSGELHVQVLHQIQLGLRDPSSTMADPQPSRRSANSPEGRSNPKVVLRGLARFCEGSSGFASWAVRAVCYGMFML